MLKSRFKIILVSIAVIIAVFSVWNFVEPVLAQGNLDTGLNFAEGTGLSAQDPRATVAKIIRYALGFLGIVAIGIIMYAGFIWMTAKGEEEKINQAKKIMMGGVIGLVIILASFGIATFVMSRLQSATNGGGGGGGGGGGVGGGGTNIFAISGTTPAHLSLNIPRNSVIRFRFTKNIKATTVNPTNFAVTANGSVAGDLSVNGSMIEFVPTANCEAPNETLKCFEKNTVYNVTVNNGTSGVISMDDNQLSCAGTSNCTIQFTTGDIVDTDVPRINLTNQQVCATANNTLRASSIDNYGVSMIDFFSGANLINSISNNSNPFIGSPFNAETAWDASNIPVGQTVTLKATAYDLDSNVASAEKQYTVAPAHCCNGVQDGDETDIDCGGSCISCSALNRPIISSVTPAGGFCMGGVNDNKFCRKATELQDCGANASCNMGTPNGMTGNFVTIIGSGFGTTRGKVFFTAANGTPTQAVLADDATAGNPACISAVWQDGQIIAVVPAGAESGKISIETSGGTDEATDDEFGPLIHNFQKNAINRPGICALSPEAGKINDVVAYQGIKLSSSEAYYGNLSSNIKALISSFNTEKQGSATVPNLSNGATTTFVLKSNVDSNYLPFTKENEPYEGPIISSIDPSTGPVGQYVTIRGSGFGATKASSKVFFGPATGFEADYAFPEVCAQSVWTDKQIIIKVPSGISSGQSFPLTVARSGFNPADSGNLTFNVTTGTPNPGVCSIEPSLGQANSQVIVWGEYFQGKNANSTARFYNNLSQQGQALSFWDIDQSASGIKPWKVITTVPQTAASGPFKIIVGTPAQESNPVNFMVGLCSQDSDCGSAAVCCASGLPEAGKCKATAGQCYGSVANSVYEWRFSTGSSASCAADQEQCGTACCAQGECEDAEESKCTQCLSGQNKCGDGTCCNQDCEEPIGGVGDSYCGDPPSCSGYSHNQCLEGFYCPNSPGLCSPYPGTNELVEVGVCGDQSCNDKPGCKGGACRYDIGLNRCVMVTGQSCKKTEMKDSLQVVIKKDNQSVQGFCDIYNNTPRWMIKDWAQTCPSGWIRISNNRCVDTSAINGNCTKCDNPFTCQMNGNEGKCAINQTICPSGSTCDPTDNKCKKPDQGTCDCCCDKNKANQDCCAGLSCEGSCGADISGTNLGLCTGCVVGGVPDDSLCNCTGSTGKFCDNSEVARGVCNDCSSITSAAECSEHAECCVDGKNGGRCTSVVPNGSRFEDNGLQYCAYYNCTNEYPNMCNVAPQITGTYNKLNACTTGCAQAPISCANELGLCDKNSPCPQNMRCDAASCTCKTDDPGPGEACRDPLTNACTGSCSTGYQCLLPTGYGNGPIGNEPTAGPGVGEDTCRCCCKPPVNGERDTCKDINPGLDCIANQGDCTSNTGERGLCCGCTSDGMCGDTATTGCGLTGARCCQSRPLVVNHEPVADATGVCRNTVIEANFNQKIDISTVSDNVKVIADYGNAQCPVGYPLVAQAELPESRFARALFSVKKFVAKIFPQVLTKSAFAVLSNYCYVPGSVVAQDINDTQTKVSFRLTRPLDPNIRYFVALQGDPGLDDLGNGDPKQYYNDNIKNLSGVGMIGSATRGIPTIFNTTEFKNTELWSFTSGADVCVVDHVSIAPNFQLFQKSGQTGSLSATARDRSNRALQSISGIYAWGWNWASDNSEVATVVREGEEHEAIATAGNKKDAQTLARAKSTIIADTVNQPTTVGQSKEGTAQLRLFLCENPWPIYSSFPPEYEWPWRDPATGIEFYYCRDRSGEGTVDDLPALIDEPIVKEGGRKICMFGSNVGRECSSDANCNNIAGSCLPEVLKEFFFFRENQTGIPDPRATADPLGSKVTLTWNAVPNATKYKVYYGLNPRQYIYNTEVIPSGPEVSKTISGLVNGLNYYFAVTALTAKNQESAFSAEIKIKAADTTPPAIPNLQVSSGDGQIALFWDKVPEAVSYIAYIGSQPRTEEGQYATALPVRTDPLPNKPNAVFSNLNNTTDYYVSVRSVDQFGNISNYAGEIKKKPNEPYLISALPANGAVTLKWLPFVNAIGYKIFYGTRSGQLTDSLEVSANTYSRLLSGLDNGTSYFFAIKAKKSATVDSNSSNERSAIPNSNDN